MHGLKIKSVTSLNFTQTKLHWDADKSTSPVSGFDYINGVKSFSLGSIAFPSDHLHFYQAQCPFSHSEVHFIMGWIFLYALGPKLNQRKYNCPSKLLKAVPVLWPLWPFLSGWIRSCHSGKEWAREYGTGNMLYSTQPLYRFSCMTTTPALGLPV